VGSNRLVVDENGDSENYYDRVPCPNAIDSLPQAQPQASKNGDDQTPRNPNPLKRRAGLLSRISGAEYSRFDHSRRAKFLC
jgi:hypothetical protein